MSPSPRRVAAAVLHSLLGREGLPAQGVGQEVWTPVPRMSGFCRPPKPRSYSAESRIHWSGHPLSEARPDDPADVRLGGCLPSAESPLPCGGSGYPRRMPRAWRKTRMSGEVERRGSAPASHPREAERAMTPRNADVSGSSAAGTGEFRMPGPPAARSPDLGDLLAQFRRRLCGYAASRLRLAELDVDGNLDDVIHTAFLRALERRPSFHTAGLLWCFLRGEVGHAVRRLRGRARRCRSLEEFPTEPIGQAGVQPSQAVVRSELAADLGGLPPDQSEVLLLRFADGCTIPEIAQSLGIAESTAKWRLYTALHRAARMLRAGGWRGGRGRLRNRSWRRKVKSAQLLGLLPGTCTYGARCSATFHQMARLANARRIVPVRGTEVSSRRRRPRCGFVQRHHHGLLRGAHRRPEAVQ